jgi:hypothetical protein
MLNSPQRRNEIKLTRVYAKLMVEANIGLYVNDKNVQNNG